MPPKKRVEAAVGLPKRSGLPLALETIVTLALLVQLMMELGFAKASRSSVLGPCSPTMPPTQPATQVTSSLAGAEVLVTLTDAVLVVSQPVTSPVTWPATAPTWWMTALSLSVDLAADESVILTELSQLSKLPALLPTTPPMWWMMVLEPLVAKAVIVPVTLTSLIRELEPQLPNKPA